jgi:hypothetical protein
MSNPINELMQLNPFSDPRLVHGYSDCARAISTDGRVIYDVDQIRRKIMKTIGLDEDDAEEFLQVNIIGSHFDENDPIFASFPKT